MEEKEFYTPTELSKITGQRPQAIYNLCKMGYIKSEIRIVEVEKMVISKEEVERYSRSYRLRKESKEKGE